MTSDKEWAEKWVGWDVIPDGGGTWRGRGLSDADLAEAVRVKFVGMLEAGPWTADVHEPPMDDWFYLGPLCFIAAVREVVDDG